MKRYNDILINNRYVRCWKLDNDVNGNPRYLIHYRSIAESWEKALKISRKVGGRAYRGKWFAGGIVISTYNLEWTLGAIVRS